MLTPEQARELKDAGLDYYNHNLDTSESHYGKVITTRTYQDRLDTLQAVRDAGINVCCGGILGLGEDELDRAQLLHTLATLPQHPESVPINQLVQVPGTPLYGAEKPQPLDFVRVIAVARLLMPRFVRAALGRPQRDERRDAGAVLPRGRELDLLRRQAADDREPRRASRPRPVRAAGHPRGEAPARRRRPADEGTPRADNIRRMSDEFFLDPRAVRRSFDRASRTYDEAAAVQGEIRTRLLERLDIVRLAADGSARPRRRHGPGEPRAEAPLSVRAGHRAGLVAGDAAAKRAPAALAAPVRPRLRRCASPAACKASRSTWCSAT